MNLVGPVRCHDCHAFVYLRKRRRGLVWMEHHAHDYWMGGTWRLHICTAKVTLTKREQDVLRKRGDTWRKRMSLNKLGGSMRYEDMGPGQPVGSARYTVGGRSVHAADASSGISKGTVRDTRVHNRQPGAYKSAPFVIKRNRNLARTVEE